MHVIGCAIALLVLSNARVAAQQSFEVPVPANQAVSPAYPRPRTTPAPTSPPAGVTTIPQVRQNPSQPPPPPPRAYQPAPPPARPEPVLPAIFRGCWLGRVAFLDSIERLPGGPPLGSWTPKTYRLCYRRTGNGPFELTFTEAGVAHNRRITNAAGRMELKSTDGRTYAAMRALLHFDEYRNRGGYFAGSTFPVDELTQLQCNIGPGGMRVAGHVYGEHGGTPWFKATWHATFVHTADEPSVTE
jgi:hypothetical protein